MEELSAPKDAFAYTAIEELVFPEHLNVSLGDGAFYRCKALKKINFPKGLNAIGEYAFETGRNFGVYQSKNRWYN